MEKAAPSRREWSRWLGAVGDPSAVTDLDLVGLPGRMRLPAGWRSAGRLGGEHLLYLVAEGGFQMKIGGEEGVAAVGDLLWIGPGVEFCCTRAGDEPLAILRVRFRLARAGKVVPAPRPWRIFRGAHAATAWFEPLIIEAVAPAAWGDLRIRGLLLALFTELARLELAEGTPAGRLTPAQRAALIRHVAARPSVRATPRELAGVVGLSADYFARCFRHTFGQSPRRWLVEQRIRHAARYLLETERRVGEVAGEFGYADVFLFSRQFKTVMGRSPSHHRRSGGATSAG